MDNPGSVPWGRANMSSSCLLLFASGHTAEVNLNAYRAAPDARRPVDAYMMSDCGSACSEAAARAVEIVHQLALRRGMHPKPMVYGFDLQGNRKASRVVGASGGLAFVVAAAIQALSLECGQVAATGILSAADPDAPLQPVASIHAKLTAALALVPENGTILYPKVNDAELDAPLRDRFAEHGIRIHGVSSAAEAVTLLAGETGTTATSSTSDLRKFVLVLLGAGILAGGVISLLYKGNPDEIPVVEQGRVQQVPAIRPVAVSALPADKNSIDPVVGNKPISSQSPVLEQEKEVRETEKAKGSPVDRASLRGEISSGIDDQPQSAVAEPEASGFD